MSLEYEVLRRRVARYQAKPSGKIQSQTSESGKVQTQGSKPNQQGSNPNLGFRVKGLQSGKVQSHTGLELRVEGTGLRVRWFA